MTPAAAVSSAGEAGGDDGGSEVDRLQKAKEVLEEQMQLAVDNDDFDEATRLQERIDELDEQIEALE